MSRSHLCIIVYWYIPPCWFGPLDLGMGWWGLRVPWFMVCFVVQTGNHTFSTYVLLSARISLPLCWPFLRVPLSWLLYKFPWSYARSLLFLLYNLATVKWIYLYCLVSHPYLLPVVGYFMLSVFLLLSSQALHVLAGLY